MEKPSAAEEACSLEGSVLQARPRRRTEAELLTGSAFPRCILIAAGCCSCAGSLENSQLATRAAGTREGWGAAAGGSERVLGLRAGLSRPLLFFCPRQAVFEQVLPILAQPRSAVLKSLVLKVLFPQPGCASSSEAPGDQMLGKTSQRCLARQLKEALEGFAPCSGCFPQSCPGRFCKAEEIFAGKCECNPDVLI